MLRSAKCMHRCHLSLANDSVQNIHLPASRSQPVLTIAFTGSNDKAPLWGSVQPSLMNLNSVSNLLVKGLNTTHPHVNSVFLYIVYSFYSFRICDTCSLYRIPSCQFFPLPSSFIHIISTIKSYNMCKLKFEPRSF